MKKHTRIAVDQYSARIAQLNDTTNVASTFSVDPTVQQKLETKMQESSEFLSKINVITVTEQEGEKVGLGVSGPIASRTNTATPGKTRQTRDVSAMSSGKYRCEKTNFDTHITYTRLDAWAKFTDFQQRVATAILQRQALDRMMIGFNGVKVSADTDMDANPLLQDVNKGWLQHLREDAPENVMGLVKQGLPGKVIVGTAAGADYVNLDAAVMDATELLDPWYAGDTGLVAIVGRKLLSDKYFPIVNTKQAPTETLAADVIVSQKRVGNLPAVSVPFFPDNAILITRFDNLSIYTQEGARRRRLVDAPESDCIKNFESANDAYVIEDNGLAVLIQNIEYQSAQA